MDKNLIIGAGLAGLLTACKIGDASIMERGKEIEQHKALLRFRDESVSHLTGIPFRAVTVRKGIHSGGQTYGQCNPAFANTYARKVTGQIAADRSIWNLDTVVRYIAPEDFYAQLVHRHRSRIQWESPIHAISPVTERQNKGCIVNTAPLPVMLQACGLAPEVATNVFFESSGIEVIRYRLPRGTDVFQTLYFPDLDVRTFRASITGDLLIIEQKTKDVMCAPRYPESVELSHVCSAFGLDAWTDLEEIERVDQKYGKIVEIPRAQREALLHELTRDYNVFSIGRFATWRNILLDDVVKDIDIVQRLMAASTYGRELVLANR
jgi:hypothetical protein